MCELSYLAVCCKTLENIKGSQGAILGRPQKPHAEELSLEMRGAPEQKRFDMNEGDVIVGIKIKVWRHSAPNPLAEGISQINTLMPHI